MFVSLLSFFYKISDDTVGGIYLTLLKTATLAGTCLAIYGDPNQIIIKFVEQQRA